TMKAVIAASFAESNSTTWLFVIFSGLALVLGAVGIYSLVSYSVAERTHEVGVRLALGATPNDVLKLILQQGMLLTLPGIAFGLAAAVGLTHFLASLLYGVEPVDPAIFAIVSILLSCVALAATYVPARRATKVDPMVALRFE